MKNLRDSIEPLVQVAVSIAPLLESVFPGVNLTSTVHNVDLAIMNVLLAMGHLTISVLAVGKTWLIQLNTLLCMH